MSIFDCSLSFCFGYTDCLMKKYVFLLLLFIIASTAIHAQASLVFVENKGQWDGGFQYRAMGASSQFYIEDAGYTVVVGHPDNTEILHESKEGKLTGLQTLEFHAYKMRWKGAQKPSLFRADKLEPYYMNFFLGEDASKWKSKIHPAKALEMTQIYKGIDVRITSNLENPKYDYIIKPYGDYKQLQLVYEGLDKIEIKNKKLQLHTSVGTVEELEPYAFQDIDGERTVVSCNYILINENTIGFELPNGYNKAYDLIIDPEVVFASLTGSIPDNWGFTATYDASGNLYGGGIVNGSSYPTSTGAFQTTFGGGTAGTSMPCDVGISKFSSDGSALLYSTYIGGSSNDYPHSMIVDNTGNLYISGKTNSTNFPTVTGSYDVGHNGGFDVFVVKLNAGGTALLAATYVGGTGDDGLNVDDGFSGSTTTLKYNYGDNARSEILLDNSNNVYVAAASQSTDFPVTATAVKTTLTGSQDGVVFKLNSTLSTLMWSTYIGGTSDDAAYVLAFSNGYANLFVAGGTQSTDFMTGYTTAGLMSTYGGGVADGFICKFQNSGTYSLLTATFVGTDAYDQIYGIQVDADHDVYVMGQTLGAFPVTTGVYSVASSRQFLMKLNNTLTTNIYSTVWGQGATTMPNIVPVAFLVDTCKNVYISGWGGSIAGGTMTGLTVTSDALQATTDGNDFYFIVFKEDATELLYATYFGSPTKPEHVDGGTSRFNPNGEVYQAICASCGPSSSSYPATAGAWASTKGSATTNCNLGVVKIAFNLGNVSANAVPIPGDNGCPPFEVTFDNLSTNASDYLWSFGDGSPTTTVESPTHIFTAPGVYTVRLIAMNESGCIERDTAFVTITVEDKELNPNFTYSVVDSCFDFEVDFTNTSTSYSGSALSTSTFIWRFGDGSPDFSGTTPPRHAFPGTGSYTVTLVMMDPEACNSPDSISKVITFSALNVIASFPGGNMCADNNNVTFSNTSENASSYLWTFGDGSNSTDATPNHTFPGPGEYTITLIANNPGSCNGSDTMIQVISIYPNPIASFYFSPLLPELNQPTSFINTSVGATSYSWDFGDGSSSSEKDPTKQFVKSGNYRVCLTAFNQYNCKDTVCKTIEALVRPILDMPTAFSPNGDGSNDVLFPRGFSVKTMHLQIYNRWGEMVFESTSMSQSWDGKYKGVDQPMEAYAYILTATFEDGTPFSKKGNVTLVR